MASLPGPAAALAAHGPRFPKRTVFMVHHSVAYPTTLYRGPGSIRNSPSSSPRPEKARSTRPCAEEGWCRSSSHLSSRSRGRRGWSIHDHPHHRAHPAIRTPPRKPPKQIGARYAVIISQSNEVAPCLHNPAIAARVGPGVLIVSERLQPEVPMRGAHVPQHCRRRVSGAIVDHDYLEARMVLKG